jgi:hypothetical protein
MNPFTRLRTPLVTFTFLAVIILSQSSCATIMGGKVDNCQRTKPKEGGQTRKVRAGYLIADALFGFVPLIVDFATNAIYKPCAPNGTAKNIQVPFAPPTTIATPMQPVVATSTSSTQNQ